MKTIEEWRTLFDAMDVQPDETEWITQKLSEDIAESDVMVPVAVLLDLERQHNLAMLVHLLKIVMAAAEPVVVEEATEAFVQFAVLDKLARVHQWMIENREVSDE